jgi:hypothetical protein
MGLAKVSGEIIISIAWAADYPALFVHPDVRSPMIGLILLLLSVNPRFCVTLEAHAVHGILSSRAIATHKVLHRRYTTTTLTDATSSNNMYYSWNHYRFQVPSLLLSRDGKLQTGRSDVQAEDSYLRAGMSAKILPHPATSESFNNENPIVTGLGCLVCCFRLPPMLSIIVTYNFC